MWNHMYDEGHFWGMHWIWWGILAILIIGIFFGLSSLRSGKSGNSALDELGGRYARGEIDKDEYEERKKVLNEE